MKTTRVHFVALVLISLVCIFSSCCSKKKLAQDNIQWRHTIVSKVSGNEILLEPYWPTGFGLDPQTKNLKKLKKTLQYSRDNMEVILIGIRKQRVCGENSHIVAAKRASVKERYKYLKTNCMFHTSYMKNPHLNNKTPENDEK